jgi:uncharacterized membrane protein YsdA (DUF1294 family)/cold shock CspA family protein
MQINEGTLVAWKDDRGFGFIQQKSGDKDIFIHIKAFQHVNFKPRIGDIVFYQTEIDASGRMRACDAYIKGHKIVKRSSNKGKEKQREGEIGYSLTAIICLPFVFSVFLGFDQKILLPLFIYSGMSLLSYLAYFLDKEKAKNKHWRIPEPFLLLLDLFGGWPGGLAAQQIIRHKNKKILFQVFFWLIVLVHFVLWMDLFFFDGFLINQAGIIQFLDNSDNSY